MEPTCLPKYKTKAHSGSEPPGGVQKVARDFRQSSIDFDLGHKPLAHQQQELREIGGDAIKFWIAFFEFVRLLLDFEKKLL